MLSKEAISTTAYGELGVPSSVGTDFTSICANLEGLGTTHHDYMCMNKTHLESYQRISSYNVTFGSETFDVNLDASTITDLKFKASDSANMICLTDLIAPSMWGKYEEARKGANNSTAKNIAVFKVRLEMYK